MLYLIRKLLCALGAFFRFKGIPKSPKLIMTLLVKNEADILEQNLLFHKTMGVDAFIVTDNNSTDGTLDLLEKYRRKGWIAEIIREPGNDYRQKVWVDRMIWKAKRVYGADWIINADADELWYAPSGNLKNELTASNANVVRCQMVCMYPEEGKPFYEWNRAVRFVSDFGKYHLSLYSLFARQIPKVAHRADGYIQISMGNHKVAMFPKRQKDCPIRIYHYNIRGKKHFIEKVVNGGQQLERNKSKHGGRHWRYFYRLFQEGKLEVEYKNVIGENTYSQLLEDGFIYSDTTIPLYFQQLLQKQNRE